MSRGPGKIERAIRALFDAHPDEAFVTDELAEHCYPGVTIERKHRVAVLRAATKVATADPDWAWYISESHGGTLVFFDQASVQSRAMAHEMAGSWVAYHSPKRAEHVRWAHDPWTKVMERPDVAAEVQRELRKPRRLADFQREVRWHIEERDGTPETVAQVQAERIQEEEQRHATIGGLMMMTNRAKLIKTAANLGLLHLVLPDDPMGPSDNNSELAALAAKARALMQVNDPDAIRAGLAEIADALEHIVTARGSFVLPLSPPSASR
jgi:Xaa-Pro aminopeptidase